MEDSWRRQEQWLCLMVIIFIILIDHIFPSFYFLKIIDLSIKSNTLFYFIEIITRNMFFKEYNKSYVVLILLDMVKNHHAATLSISFFWRTPIISFLSWTPNFKQRLSSKISSLRSWKVSFTSWDFFSALLAPNFFNSFCIYF